MPLVYRDVMLLYRAALEKRDAGLAEPVPYERYIAWLQSQGIAPARAHWQQVLGRIEAATPLVIDKLGSDGEHGYRERVLELTPEATQALQALAKSQHTTVNTLLQWSWGYLLHRYSGENDVVFGATISGRAADVAGVEDMVGLFINTIPVKVSFGDGDDVAAQLGRLHAEFQRSNDYGYLSLLDIQRQSQVRSGSNLFDSILAFENYPLDAMLDAATAQSASDQGSLEIESTGNDEQTNYKLCITALIERNLHIKCGYRAEDFSADSIRRLLGHLQQILLQLPKAMSGQRIRLLSDAEQHELARFNASSGTYPNDRLIHRVFEQQVRERGDAVALVYADRTLSYTQLNQAANRLAHALIGQGVKPDDRVAICAERGLDLVVGLLAILKAGGAYVPLDPVYPAERLAYLLDDAAPVALLTQSALRETLPLPAGLPVLLLDATDVAVGPLTDPEVAGLDASHLAYVIYTSGSTGQPKGVMVEHGHVTRLFAATQEAFQFDANDVWTLFHSFAFDFSVWEIWGALLYGGRLVIVPGLVARTPAEFYELVSREGVTVLNQTPTAFRGLIAAQARSESAHRLRRVIFGGEALELHMLAPWLARNDGDKTVLVNMYGITEITVHATYRRISAEDVAQSRGSVIGRALPDLQLYVLDAQGEPVPLGVTGELYVGGAGVARGYLNRPQLSAERFVADPFSTQAQARLYRTGDLGRWLADGGLEYLGRNDFQVKIRGFRIELGEIEARLSACAGVAEAVVVAREDVPGDKRLVAYVVAREAAVLAVADLREALAQELPEHMIPAAFVLLDAVPLTANGKLDRSALPAPDQSAVLTREYAAPQGEVEQAIAATWQTLMGLDRVGRHDHFFELGGHSLLAVRMLGELRARFNLEISIRDVFERTTLADLAAYVEERLQLSSLKQDIALDAADNNDQELIEL